jgi:hypothetical protein
MTDEIQAEYTRIVNKHAGRVPIIFDPNDNTPLLKKNKFLVPRDLSIGQLMAVIRRQLIDGVAPEEALFIMTASGFMPCTTSTIADLEHEQFPIGTPKTFLHLVVSKENTFG